MTKKVLDKPTPSIEELAKKWKLPVSRIRQLVRQGAKVEHEHTNEERPAEEIARDHLGERPDYYSKLEKAGLEEEITDKTPLKDVIHDFVHSKNKTFKGHSKKLRIKQALAAWYAKQNKQQREEVEMDKEVSKTVKEAVVDLIKEDFVSMRDRLHEALEEKAIAKLDERKKRIAENYFDK